ncbi:MAG TPA: hypothetical protein VM677_17850 [Actinokineospora sp.]|nr:hypothetical protein [Actinokineospora sp.]
MSDGMAGFGRIVHYTLSEWDVAQITTAALNGAPWREHYNQVAQGQTFPALIVRDAGECVNLQVFVDGAFTYWATSRTRGDQPGQWTWPVRPRDTRSPLAQAVADAVTALAALDPIGDDDRLRPIRKGLHAALVDALPVADDPRRFYLDRAVDVTGASGTGRVADGVLWPDGTATVRWRGERRSTAHWDRMADAEAIHGHGGATRIVWLDDY